MNKCAVCGEPQCVCAPLLEPGSLEDVLADRGREYGDFRDQAQIAQDLKDSIYPHYKDDLRPFQREALEMILHKISRIVNGNPNNVDSWKDIEGYARIVRERL
jgi:hypothetical protein